MSYKKVLKVIVFAVFAVIMLKACTTEYYCDIVDTIPLEIREQIIKEKPECAKVQELAEFWIEHRDSLVSE